MEKVPKQWYNHDIRDDLFNPMMECIQDFHEKFGLEYLGTPRFLDLDMSEFRIKFMQEELDEYKTARSDGDLEKQLDALVDLMYVALGTAYLHGFDIAEAFYRVHKANMNKVRVSRETEDLSTRKSQYDVVKPEGWVPPFLKDLA